MRRDLRFSSFSRDYKIWTRNAAVPVRSSAFKFLYLCQILLAQGLVSGMHIIVIHIYNIL